MTFSRLRPCARPGCPELTQRRYCAIHLSTDARQSGHGQRWRRLRRSILNDEPICAACGREMATEVDHVVPVRRGGDEWSRDNLQALCKGCHKVKSSREARVRR